jgi:hypothetical protein
MVIKSCRKVNIVPGPVGPQLAAVRKPGCILVKKPGKYKGYKE